MTTFDTLTAPLRHVQDFTQFSGHLTALLASRFDVIAPQAAISLDKPFAITRLDMPTAVISETGVIGPRVEAEYTRTAMRQLADRLRIPLAYLDRLVGMEHSAGPMLASHSINELARLDQRSALYRYLRSDDRGLVLRAVLSDRYAMLDNDAALGAILTGLTENGLGLGDCEVDGDVSMDRLRLRIAVPAIAIAAPDVLGDYRSPFSDRTGRELPIIWAGVEIANSETGGGAFSIAPRAVIQICRNGMTRAVEFRRTHVGASMNDGVVDWSEETRQNALALITSQVTDAVRTFISPAYLATVVDEMRVAKGHAVASATTATTVVSERFGFTEDETSRLLDLFMLGGETTVLGLGQAVTALAQEAETGDQQAALELAGAEILARPAQFVGAA